MRILTLLTFLLATSFHSEAQQLVLGKWKTIDDHSGSEKSIVEIFERSGKIHGRIVRIFPAPGKDPDPVCDQCPQSDARFKKKIIGMEIIRDMVKSGDEYSKGDILDPETGKVYSCKFWIEGKVLKVRGYWGPFYRTQTWMRSN
jgi:uncharacterized protein (DUF2147 family)